MAFERGPELEALRTRAPRCAEDRLYPLELRVEENGPLAPEVSRALLEQAIAEALWPMNVPRAMGGLGSTVMAQVIAQEEAGRATNDPWGYVAVADRVVQIFGGRGLPQGLRGRAPLPDLRVDRIRERTSEHEEEDET